MKVFWAFWLIFLYLTIVSGLPPEDRYGEEFDDGLSVDYNEYYDPEEYQEPEGEPDSTDSPVNGRRLPWYYISPEEKARMEEEYGEVNYDEDYDGEEEGRLREEDRRRRYEAERRSELEEEQRRRQYEEEEELRRQFEEEKRKEEEERRRKQYEEERRYENERSNPRDVVEESRRRPSSNRQRISVTTTPAASTTSSYDSPDPSSLQATGNKLVHMGYRREDQRCPYGFVMDIYGYCRSIFQEEERDWSWWENIRRYVISQHNSGYDTYP